MEKSIRITIKDLEKIKELADGAFESENKIDLGWITGQIAGIVNYYIKKQKP